MHVTSLLLGIKGGKKTKKKPLRCMENHKDYNRQVKTAPGTDSFTILHALRI